MLLNINNPYASLQAVFSPCQHRYGSQHHVKLARLVRFREVRRETTACGLYGVYKRVFFSHCDFGAFFVFTSSERLSLALSLGYRFCSQGTLAIETRNVDLS